MWVGGGDGEQEGNRVSMSGSHNPREILKLICLVIMCWQISYWKDTEPEDSVETVRTRGNESFVMLTELEGNTLYHLTVRAYNGAGYGPPSREASATTKRHRKWPGIVFVWKPHDQKPCKVHNKQRREPCFRAQIWIPKPAQKFFAFPVCKGYHPVKQG